MTINEKKIFILLILLIVVGSLIVLNIKSNVITKPEDECSISVEEKIVRGNSLQGLIEGGQTVKIFFGYYDCNEIQREDIIIYSYAGNSEPLIKIVKGIPGDKFSFQETENGWYILINEKILKNSKNEPYLLDERGYKMLSLYEKDYNGVIPEQVFLIMGNLALGSIDSSHYGLVHKNDILGKAVINMFNLSLF